MNDFYITLPIHSSTNEFPNNASNSFKIPLPHPIRPEGGEWKVGLVAVSLPDPINKLPDLMKNDNNYLVQTHWLEQTPLHLHPHIEDIMPSFKSET